MEWKKAQKIEGDKRQNVIDVPPRWLFPHYYEALNVLFRIENALRVFVYIVLKNEFRDKWSEISITSDDSDQGTINSIAKKRIAQAQNFGYLGYIINCPIMHLTSGELIRLITSDAYWKCFSRHFPASKSIIENKLYEIGNVRNSLAHFRPIKEDDVEVVKQNAKQVLMSIETCLTQIFNCDSIVPTNTNEEWYRELKTLGTDNCILHFYQSTDETWIKVNLIFKNPAISKYWLSNTFVYYRALRILSSAILREFDSIANYIVYSSEYVPEVFMDKEYNVMFEKTISFVFSKSTITKDFKEIKALFEKILISISEETALIIQDNLAKGKMVDLVDVNAAYRKTSDEDGAWDIWRETLYCKAKEIDPSEFWGKSYRYIYDFIAGIHIYPWMPIEISRSEIPYY